MDPAQLFVRWTAIQSATFKAFGFSALIYWVVDADLSPLQLVLLGTALEISVLAAEIPTGVMADTFSRKWSLVVSQFVMGAGMIMSGITTDFVPLLLSQVVWGVGWTFKSGADIAWVTDELDDPARIDSVIALGGRWRQLAAVGGLTVGGGLAWATSLSTTIVVSGIVSMIVGVGIAVLFPEKGFHRVQEDRLAESVNILKTGLKLARSDRQIRLILGVTLLLNSGAEAVDRLHPRLIVDLGLPESPEPIVWFTALGIVGSLAGALGLRWVEYRIAGEGAPRLIYAGAVIIAVLGTLVMAAAPTAWVGIGGTFLTRGVAFAVIPVVASTWINQRARTEVRATVQSFLGQAESVGEISGGLVLGAVAQAGGVPLALSGSAGLFATAALVLGRTKTGRRSVSADVDISEAPA